MTVIARIRSKNLHTWMGGYARHLTETLRRPKVRGPRHLLFALCDHFEPLWGKPTLEVGDMRVAAWESGYPVLARQFRDFDGRPPRHTFFFPGEEYEPRFLDRLATLARSGFGEVELHLHHDRDTADNLRRTIEEYLKLLSRHGHISRDQDDRFRYAFIHGNWCLSNARKDGRWCGVDDELPILFETGCYADFTFPSAPDECQPNTVNQIYWPSGDLARRRAYEGGERARVGRRAHDRLLFIQGPLAIARRPGAASLRIDSAAIAGGDPATPHRVRTWVAQNVHVLGRPEWVFVKIHTHGAPEKNAESLLGDGGRMLHRELTSRYNDGIRWRLHYVTAREMFNVAAAAMDGKSGDPGEYLDYAIAPPPIALGSQRAAGAGRIP